MKLVDLRDLIAKNLALNNIEAQLTVGHNLIIMVEKEQIIPVLTLLKNNKELNFNLLTEIFAADFPKRSERFEIVYNLLSMEINSRVIVKTRTEENMVVESAISVFPAANWYEREVYDLFGVKFSHHPNLHRILTDYEFTGHPLRKDFPLSGYTQVKYDDKSQKIVHEPVKLDQEYRDFNFASSWKGPNLQQNKSQND